MAQAESFYNEISDRYLIALSQCDYAKAAEIVKEVSRWLGCRRSTEQILPTGDITGQAGYLCDWAERRVAVLERMAKNG